VLLVGQKGKFGMTESPSDPVGQATPPGQNPPGDARQQDPARELQSLLACLSGLFYRCELRSPWRMTFISQGLEALTGYSLDEIEALNGWAELMLVQDRGTVAAAVAAAIEGRTGFELSYRIAGKNGEVRWVSERGHAVYGEDGQPLFLEGVITDVSGSRQAEEMQRTLIAKWRKTLDTIPQMVWTMAADGSAEYYNSRWLEFTGVAIRKGVSRLDLVHEEDREYARDAWQRSFANGEPYEAKYRLRHVSGDHRWVLSRGHPEVDDAGRIVRWYGTCTDIHEQVIAQEALQASEATNRSIIEASPDCVSLLDMEGDIVFMNDASVTALQLKSPRDLIGRSWGDVFPGTARGPAKLAVKQALSGRQSHFSASQPSPEGHKWWDVVVAPIKRPGARQTGLLAIARDITHQKSAEDRVRWAANHDALTQLPNRTLFQRSLDRQLSEARDSGGRFTVLMMDLDNFKRTNDALGHAAGDALLIEFAARVRQALRADDVVARFGGDEFAVVLNNVGTEEEVEDAVASITVALKSPCMFDGKLIDIRTSIGACSYPHQGTTRTELLKNADIALYVAKASGRGVHKLFALEMRAEMQNRMSMLSIAREALTGQLIEPHYQPKYDLRTGELDGFEALLRWQHPLRGLQGPDTIAAAFEDATLAAEISDQMIERAMRDMRGWQDQGVNFEHVAVNASAAEFKRGDFAERALERLHRAQLSPRCLQIEVTETVFLGRGAEHVEEALRLLASEGVQIALDDFGTGYASLSHLNHFPVGVIKIDRSFIRNLEASAHDAAIVRAVINLGRSLGIKIVAEGVETAAQATLLRRYRCHSGQGYLFGKAQAAASVPAICSSREHEVPAGQRLLHGLKAA
jgi:diguanylate cyclase (GGDEF)-like protein/PAS domain S-box-containing protein